LGYEYNLQVRFYSGFLRSFGTLDDPFAYAAFLLFAMAAVVTWHRLSTRIVLSGVILSAGLVVAYVRTAGIIGAALLGIWLAQKDRIGAAVALLLSAIVVSVVILFSTGGASESRTYAGDGGYVTLNGRTEAWEVAIGDTPAQVLFGQGVGQLGRAAERARYTLSGELEERASGKVEAVDSGYFATVSDVGFVGLVVLLVLYARLFALAASAARARLREGWLALALLAVLMLDATTRDSFAGFPTAFVGLLLVGIALAAARERTLRGGSGDAATV
jgi:O-antigen ligase